MVVRILLKVTLLLYTKISRSQLFNTKVYFFLMLGSTPPNNNWEIMLSWLSFNGFSHPVTLEISYRTPKINMSPKTTQHRLSPSPAVRKGEVHRESCVEAYMGQVWKGCILLLCPYLWQKGYLHKAMPNSN